MAAISARLANMGFMKRQVAKASDPAAAQKAPAAHPPSLRQQQQQQRSSAPGSRHQGAVAAATEFEPSPATSPTDPQATAAADSKQQQHSKKRDKTFKLSDNITNMKFMQRAQLKRSREEAGFEQEQAAKDAAEWVSATAVHEKGCLVVQERDPLPAGVNGRMSFGFGLLHDLAQAEEAERLAAAEAAAAEASIRAEEMGRYAEKSGKGFRSKDMAKRENKRQRRH